MSLVCSDSDAAIRELLQRYPEARDIEIAAPGSRRLFLSSPPRGRVSMTYSVTSCCACCATAASSSSRWPSRWSIYVLIAAPNRDATDFAGTGLTAPLYYMVGLATFGTMTAMLVTGTRIAGERANGWNRLLRTTPLSPRAYLRTKVVSAYLTALSPSGCCMRRASRSASASPQPTGSG